MADDPTQIRQLDLGARFLGADGTRFLVWAPRAKEVAVRLLGENPRLIPMVSRDRGYFETVVPEVRPGDRYLYRLDDRVERVDPASRFQPEGVHAPSAVVDPASFRWTDGSWRGLSLEDLIIYELHTGTFTQAGTFEAVIPLLDYLKNDVGITAIELMPVAQFPGRRNWGYDGVYPFAPQSSYGGPQGLKTLVDACHAKGLAVILDVVYNHLGPEGNYLGEFGPYFTDHYRTPWGSAINYDGPDSDEVRHYVVGNALYWVTEYHVDALRLDAIHGIYDFGAKHILDEIAEAVHEQAARLGRRILVIAESSLNDARIIAPRDQGGYGLDAQWNDDFHHALRTTLLNERAGYYEDFNGLPDLATAVQDGFVYSGQYSPHRRRRHGNTSRGRFPAQFVVFAQNHDQIGNRALGDRLSALVPFEALKVAAASVLLSPNVPLLFMGEEYGETAPFQYFIEHGDPQLVEAVRRGRQEEFASFGWREELPDPQDLSTFERSRVRAGAGMQGRRADMLRWTKALIDLRKSVPSLGAAASNRRSHRVWLVASSQILVVHRCGEGGRAALILLGFNQTPTSLTLHEPAGLWRLCLGSTHPEFGGPGGGLLPADIKVTPDGTGVRVPAYAVGVFLADSTA
jgi:maltooligosyltrehalose trehalohydrolase